MDISKVKVIGIDQIKFPEMIQIEQNVPDIHLTNIFETVQKQIAKTKFNKKIKEGSKVAIAVGSRNIDKLADIVSEIITEVKKTGGIPFIVPAMGSHGGCSGSAIADVGGLGPLEIDMMEKGGYKKPFAVALTVSSSIQGPIIPPSIPLVLVGAVTGTSIGGLLVGGLIPGILIGLSQCLVVFIIAKKRKFPRFIVNLSFVEAVKLVLNTIPFLLMPVIILGGII
ncbi:unnamed protein product, partial [marine sediment metagenome]